MNDPGHAAADRLLAEMERKIAAEYLKAVRNAQAKLEDYLRRFDIKDQKWLEMVANGEKTLAEYQKWRIGQLAVGERWKALRDSLARDFQDASITAREIIDGYLPEIYAANMNYATYLVEHGGKVNTSFTLYNREAVNRILRDNPDLLPKPGANMLDKIARGEAVKWQEGQIQSVMMQSILTGESIPNIAKRIAKTLGEINHKATIRYARTAATAAENAGKQDAFKRATEMGVKMMRVWEAVHDNRTRHEHRMLDGQERGVDEPFEVDGETIMYPGDPAASPGMIWNCRCGLTAKVKGWESKSGQLREDMTIGGMSYDEWREAKPVYRDIKHQEDVGNAMAHSYIKELYGGT